MIQAFGKYVIFLGVAIVTKMHFCDLYSIYFIIIFCIFFFGGGWGVGEQCRFCEASCFSICPLTGFQSRLYILERTVGWLLGISNFEYETERNIKLDKPNPILFLYIHMYIQIFNNLNDQWTRMD